MIRINNLSKTYGSNQVLNDVNLHFETGKVYGIVGENGAGKTTLFKCIAGIETHEGEIESEFPILKNHLGFLQTIPYFFSKITGREYLQLLSNARDINVEDLDNRNIFELPLDQYASTYSTGMKKKLALTAILMQKNDLFILDEPFNGVDIQSNMVIMEIIKKLKEIGKTMLISSHIFSTLSETCDEIYLLKEGKIIKKASKAEFAVLDQEMKNFTVGSRIERLNLE